jgi:hypothetical protein
MTRLDEIPTISTPPPDARPSEIVAHIRTIRPNRRTVLRGLVIAAAATALVPLDWYLSRREASAADRYGDDKSEHMTCAPASYTEEANNWPSSGPAVCYGGYRRGSYPCSSGYHREGYYAGNGETYDSTRLAANCEGKNAWRWHGWRCSDAITMITFADGDQYNGITIAACALPTDSGSGTAPTATATPKPTSAPSGGGHSSDDDGRDPSRPRRGVPDLGLGMRPLPGVGSLSGR